MYIAFLVGRVLNKQIFCQFFGLTVEYLLIDSGKKKAQDIMDLDQQLLMNLNPKDLPILHLYEWQEDSVTYGYFTNPYNYLKKENCRLSLAKRPTGGGVTFHLTDFAFSLFIPATSPYFSENTLENYAFINSQIGKLISALFGLKGAELLIPKNNCEKCANFCMAQPTQYDLTFNGLKIAGAAQRKTKRGFLHHGTISLAKLPHELLETILIDQTIVKEIQSHSFYLLSENCSSSELLECREILKQGMKDQLFNDWH